MNVLLFYIDLVFLYSVSGLRNNRVNKKSVKDTSRNFMYEP